MKLKTALKIFVPVVILSSMFIASVIMRHEIISHALTVSISKKTNKNMTLKVDSVNFNLLSSTVLLKNVVLSFDSLELNQENTLQLQALRFDNIKMSGISAFRLLLFREISARSLEISGPSTLLSSENAHDTVKVSPREIISKLNQNKDLFGKLVIKIDQILIRQGHFAMEKMIKDRTSSLEFDYGFQVYNFNTESVLYSDTTRFLFSSEIKVKLDSIVYITASGDGITSDSITFISGSTRLGVFGLDLKPSETNDNNNSISGHIKHIEVDGLLPDSLADIFDIQLKAVIIDEAHLVIDNHQPQNINTKKPVNSLLNSIRTLALNSTTIHTSSLLILDEGTDTLLCTQINHLKLEDLMADSGFLADPKKISLKDLDWDLNELQYFNPKQQIEFSMQSSIFNETTGELDLNTLKFLKHYPQQTGAFNMDIKRLRLHGLFLSQLLQQKPVGISATITSPEVRINQITTRKASDKKKPFNLPEYLTLNSVDIIDGQLNWVKEGLLSVDINSIQLRTGDLNFRGMSHLDIVQLDSLLLNTNDLNINWIKDNIHIHWQQFALTNQLTELKQLTIQIPGYDDLTMKSLLIEKPDLRALAKGEPLSTGRITCNSPQFTGNIDLRKKTQSKTDDSSTIAELKNLLSTEGLTINGGKINTNIFLTNDTIHLKTSIGIYTRKFTLTNKMDESWLAKLKWSVTLNHPEMHHHLGSASAKTLKFDNGTRKLEVNNLDFQDHRNTGNPLVLNELRIGQLSMDEINYKKLVLNNTLEFGSFWVNNPIVDLELLPANPKNPPKSKERKTINMQDLPFAFREIGFKNLKVHIVQLDSTRSTDIDMGEVDFRITNPGSQSSNLTDHLELTINRLSFTDQQKLHQLSVKKLQFNPKNNHLEISGISGAERQKTSETDTSTVLMTYHLSEIDFNRININNTFPAKVSIQKIKLHHPEIKYQIPQNQFAQHPSDTGKLSKINLPKSLEQLQIDTLVLSDLDFHQTQRKDSGVVHTAFTDLNVQANHILLDTSGISADDFSFIESTRVELGKNDFISSDSLYVTSIAAVNFNFLNQSLTLDSLHLAPRYPDAEFFDKAVYQTDQMNVFGEKIVCGNIRLKNLIKTGTIHMGSIDIYGLSAKLYRDKRFPMDPNAYKKMPQEMIFGVQKPFLIDSIITHNAEIHYKEIVEKAKEPGYINFNQFNLKLYHLTNIHEQLVNDSIVYVNLKAKIMGQTDLSLHLFLDMKSPGQKFWFSGYTETLNFKILNPVTQNLVGIDMQEGDGRVLMPMIKGDSSHTSGSVLFLYKKLKVGLYNREKAKSTTGIAKGMANLLLNDVFIRSNNPTFLRKPKTGVVYSDRVTEKSFVFYVWKSILSGMVSTFGINTKEQRQEKREMKPSTD